VAQCKHLLVSNRGVSILQLIHGVTKAGVDLSPKHEQKVVSYSTWLNGWKRTVREEGDEEAMQTEGYFEYRAQRDAYSLIHVSGFEGCPGSLGRRSPKGCAARVRLQNANFFGHNELLWTAL
jgi:hypothetical protein